MLPTLPSVFCVMICSFYFVFFFFFWICRSILSVLKHFLRVFLIMVRMDSVTSFAWWCTELAFKETIKPNKPSASWRSFLFCFVFGVTKVRWAEADCFFVIRCWYSWRLMGLRELDPQTSRSSKPTYHFHGLGQEIFWTFFSTSEGTAPP